jgi:hypothetical protein
MARTEHLPIYKASYDLCLYLEQVVHGFLRSHKYTLGTDLRDAARPGDGMSIALCPVIARAALRFLS